MSELPRCINHEEDCRGILIYQGNKHFWCPLCKMGTVLTPMGRTVPPTKGRNE